MAITIFRLPSAALPSKIFSDAHLRCRISDLAERTIKDLYLAIEDVEDINRNESYLKWKEILTLTREIELGILLGRVSLTFFGLYTALTLFYPHIIHPRFSSSFYMYTAIVTGFIFYDNFNQYAYKKSEKIAVLLHELRVF